MDAFIDFLRSFINSGEFGTLLGFGLTAFIVWVTSHHQSEQFIKTIHSQERISKAQNDLSKKALIAQHRQNWIKELRELLSEYLSVSNQMKCLIETEGLKSGIMAKSENYSVKSLFLDENQRLSGVLEKCESKIQFHLNPLETEHVALLNLLSRRHLDIKKLLLTMDDYAEKQPTALEVTLFFRTEFYQEWIKNYEKTKAKIVDISRIILKQEWEKIKKMQD